MQSTAQTYYGYNSFGAGRPKAATVYVLQLRLEFRSWKYMFNLLMQRPAEPENSQPALGL